MDVLSFRRGSSAADPPPETRCSKSDTRGALAGARRCVGQLSARDWEWMLALGGGMQSAAVPPAPNGRRTRVFGSWTFGGAKARIRRAEAKQQASGGTLGSLPLPPGLGWTVPTPPPLQKS